MWEFGGSEVRRFGGSEVRRFGGSEVRRFGGSEGEDGRYNDPAAILATQVAIYEPTLSWADLNPRCF